MTEYALVMKGKDAIQTRSMNLFLAVILISIIVISGIAYWYYLDQKQTAIQTAREKITRIGDLKAGEVSNWLRERLGNAETLFHDYLGTGLQPLLADPIAPMRRQHALNWMATLAAHAGNSAIFLLDTTGNILLSYPENTPSPNHLNQALIERALRHQHVGFSGLYLEEKVGALYLDLAVPLLLQSNDQKSPIGILLLRIDPEKTLFPSLQTWPAPSTTAEILLVRREGDEFVVINTLRDHQDAPSTLRLPLNGPHLPSIMAAQGFSGTVEGIDYRGAEVLAAIRSIPNSEWHLIAKIDKQEIEEPLQAKALKTLSIFVIPTLFTFLAVWVIWRKQSENMSRERAAHLRPLFDRSPFPLLVSRIADSTVLEANQAASDFLQLSSKDLVGMKMTEFYADPTDRNRLIEQLRDQGRISHFDCQLKTGGEQRWVIISAFTLTHCHEPAILEGFADIHERKRLEDELRQFATIDSLTGALNRRHFLTMAGKELRRAERYPHPLSLLMIDVDYFKQVNDNYGHSTGDKVLKEIAHTLRSNLRDQDLFGRLGGEEFAIILPEIDQAAAIEVAERLRERVAATEIATQSTSLRLTISIGITERISADRDADTLLKRADKALYEAKGKGRNRVVTYGNMAF